MDGAPIEIEMHQGLGTIAASDWDACACPEAVAGGRANDPFTTYRFLKAIEDSGSVGPGTGWQPRYLTARANDEVIACAPLYVKSHSQGEYVFDYSWAHAYENAGGRYYPKMQVAVPFTPVSGRRLLTRPGFETTGKAALVQGMVQVADDNELSSLHLTFCEEDEVDAGQQMGLLHRTAQQFHWLNENYQSFDEFLASLSSRKRKNIRKERQKAQAFGGEILCLSGEEIRPEHWDAMWRFYQDTGARKWGTPYLTRDFFDMAHDTLRDDILLILAKKEGHYVAGAMNLIGQEALFGRYWGCVEDHPCLHFELCYYQAMDWAISHGLGRVEAGAQGEHKLARGYLPVTTHSLHWMRDPGFADAVARFLEAEREAVAEEIEVMTAWGPFRKDKTEDHE
ncbi:GNAT family N-acetyltransferase [Shimia thalassica]|uniref:GNAT family N-acetyltransferase n=1 Tax=Shimia thalassica TaxID=1715693 RepID=UPI001C088DD4|nr:GNAT family N-acetyltransferase [Shimia thalassica]MBU2943363.1 GNAT family N-acetyltransferase [Shimia thalassica]MDO6501432.1 GNAT family N-acetyltransferase [Shimia thalassica]